jgi:hypothetical protein
MTALLLLSLWPNLVIVQRGVTFVLGVKGSRMEWMAGWLDGYDTN